MEEVLRIENLYLRRPRFMVCNVNLAVQTGQILAVSGKSGAGKSTLIRGIGGANLPLAGRILYWGRELYEDEVRIRRRMSVVYDEPNFNTELTPKQLVRQLAKFEPFFDREAFFVYMEQLELKDNRRVKLCSAGTVKKLMLVLALCRGPKLLVMDEPTGGVDADARKLMWDIIEDYRSRNNLAIVCATHHREELLYADAVLHMHGGACGIARPLETDGAVSGIARPLETDGAVSGIARPLETDGAVSGIARPLERMEAWDEAFL